MERFVKGFLKKVFEIMKKCGKLAEGKLLNEM
jgi:hypothetical protein